MNKIYKKNLAVIKDNNIQLYKKILSLDEEKLSQFTVEETKIKGEYTLKIDNKGRVQYINSKYDPLKNSENKIKNLTFNYYNIVLVFGVGCGHYIKEILNKINRQSKIIVLENRIDILKKVLKYQDLRYIFTSDNIIFFDTSKKDYLLDVQNRFKKIDIMALVAGNLTIFETPVLKKIEHDTYKKQTKKLIDILKYLANIMGNSSQDTLLGIEHMFENIQYLFRNSFDFTKTSYFKDKPAVCVASGPSLDKNIDVLKEYQDNVFIFSAGTSLYKLIDYGIKPDFFSVLERPEKVYDYTIRDLIEEEKYPDNMIAFLDGVVHNKIFKESLPNNIPVCRNTVPSERWFGKNIDNLITLDTGTSVANLNFMIAYLLGCSPIILVGQDLAFSNDGKQHVKGTIYDKLGEETIRDKDYVEVRGQNGEKLLSKKVWKDFKEWFEIKIVEHEINCIDATEGGAYINGSEIMNLRDVAKKHFNLDKRDDINKIFDLETKTISSKNINLFLEKVEDKIYIYQSIKEEIQYIIASLKIFYYLSRTVKFNYKKEIDFNYLIERYYSLNTEISDMMTADPVFFFVCQPAFIELERNKVRKGDISKDTIKKIRRWAEFNIDTLNDILEITDKTIKIFEKGKNKILKFEEIFNEK